MNSDEFWWDRYPGKLEAELDALRKAGISFEIDERMRNQGVMRLCLSNVKVADEVFNLNVTFPDLYPFFKFEVQAPTLDLAIHQNPFEKNLCIIDRPTECWHTTDTVASLLSEQLPMLLQTARETDKQKVVGIEAQQAEPYSEYYRNLHLPGSSILVQSEWDMGNESCGRLKIGLTENVEPNQKYPVKGVVLKVFNNGQKLLAEADSALYKLKIKKTVDARWVRVQTHDLPSAQPAFFNYIQGKDSNPTNLKQNQLQGGYLSIYAAVFHEQHKWRDESGVGWLFVCRVTKDRIGTTVQRHFAQSGKGK